MIKKIETEEEYKMAKTRLNEIIYAQRGTPERDELNLLIDLMFDYEILLNSPEYLPRRHSMRNIIQINIETSKDDDGAYIWALCNDGTVWWRSCSGKNEKWTKINDIPQEGFNQ